MQKQSFVVFDFDGTLSTLRCGWEQIMQPMMLEMICPDGPCPPELEARVAAYIDQSTGIQTVRQMQWLAGQVEQSRVIRTPLPLRMPVKYRPSRSSVTGSGCRTGKTMSMGTGV